MGAEQRKNFKSSSWPKTVVWKWLNLKSAADEFHSDHHGVPPAGTAPPPSSSTMSPEPTSFPFYPCLNFKLLFSSMGNLVIRSLPSLSVSSGGRFVGNAVGRRTRELRHDS
ncbi:hypothetical protein AXF42_Ash014880 [Apostasia shenzhenica]|uniref:Uncharacterized protein n=1 Tax=Apostasia shenzhenica TaxID=1088818 RepID=A0A2I0ALF8_9ASPA|nr:hypothetical protein AXF42_Ash014880 [Apostasia shenzhenica]